jgi:hypothetical protein
MSDPGMGRAMELDVRRRFWVALALTVPIAVLAGHIPSVPMLIAPPLSSWLGLALATSGKQSARARTSPSRRRRSC